MLLTESLLGSSSAPAANYIEDVFSTYLYTGNGSLQGINNGIDLSGKGGLVWLKSRSGATAHALYDTERGATFDLVSNTTAAQTTQSTGLVSFNSTGFEFGSLAKINTSSSTYVSWTFRKQAKFFDVVTYTGNGVNGTAISHSLGSVPGCIIIKRTDTTGDWYVYHRSYNGGVNPEQYTTYLNLANAVAGPGSYSQYQAPTSTAFYPGAAVNAVGGSAKYVAYLFAHNAGGFGAAGTDNVISCGSYTGNGSINGPTVTLGYEPQLLLVKKATGTGGGWSLWDNMRGLSVTSGTYLIPNTTDTDQPSNPTAITPNATGFQITNDGSTWNSSGDTFIYMAIRRGPMKTPTNPTTVFRPGPQYFGLGSSFSINVNPGFVVDCVIDKAATQALDWLAASRLVGATRYLSTNLTSAEVTDAGSVTTFASQVGINMGGSAIVNSSGQTYTPYFFRRAPGFFDVVCYTGTGGNRTVSHNLGVAPELMIVKSRSNTALWMVYSSAIGATKYLQLSSDAAPVTQSQAWNDTAPTSSVFTVGLLGAVNASSSNFVSYLFATCPGVSKVGSYTGSGTTKQIDCGFTSGARFILIKRTDSTGDWYVWDSTRGIVASNDPYLLINSSAAEITNTDYVDTYSAGFEISSTAPAAINASGGTFIFLAIA